MSAVYISGVGLLAPGMPDWTAGAAVLRGDLPYVFGQVETPKPSILPKTLLRRTFTHGRIAVAVADEAMHNAQLADWDVASVFASSEADPETTHEICVGVTADEPRVSPTRFQNSVNNAAAGNWCIAANAPSPSTSVTGHDGSVGVGLLEAVAQVQAESRPVLLVAHDTLPPPPLHALRPFVASFGAAVLLTPSRTAQSLAAVRCALVMSDAAPTSLVDPELEQLRQGNAAAAIMPVLSGLVTAGGTVDLPYFDGQLLRVEMVVGE